MEDTIEVYLDNRQGKQAKDLRLVIEVEANTYARLEAQANRLHIPVNVLVAANVIDRIKEGGAYTVMRDVPF